jgi:penicillin-binding protein 1A
VYFIKEKNMIGKFFKFVAWLFLITAGVTAGISLSYILKVYNNLPELSAVDFNVSTLVYDSKGLLLDEIHGEEHRKPVSIQDIDQDIIDAVIAIEDQRFYEHEGIDWQSVGRAFKQNFKDKTISSGASTITMQVIKNLYLSDERTWDRKIGEAFLARELEQQKTKEEILQLYLNTVYWGNNTYGIYTATENYFGKTPDDVEPHEAAMLAALIQNPSRFNPYTGNYEALKARQKTVLEKLYPEQPDMVAGYYGEPLLVTGKTTWQKSLSGFITEAAVKELKNTLDLNAEDIETGGYKIYTTVDKNVQDKAIAAIQNNSGWKGDAQMALVSVDVNNNKIRATVGSKDFDVSPLNRSLDSYRQPGSSVKPFVYYKLLDLGYDRNYIVDDSSTCIGGGRWSKPYCPRNYGGGFSGPDTIENHLIKSRNIPAIKVGQIVGIDRVISTMRDLGFTTKLENIPSFPLGSNDLKPVEMANAYAAFATGGYQAPYTIIEKVVDKYGEVVIDNTTRTQKQILEPDAVAELNAMLNGVVERGTGTAARIPGLVQAGKTGTTSLQADVWFAGYTADISTVVWIGNDDYHKKLPGGATGGGWSAPVYRDFVSSYYNK